jgi:hypothetical protein
MFRDMNPGATTVQQFEHHNTTRTLSNSVFLDGGENNIAHTNVHTYNNSAAQASHPADGSLPHSTFLRTATRASHTTEITRAHMHCLYLEAPLDELGEVRLQEVLLHDLQQRLSGRGVQQPSAHLHALLQKVPQGLYRSVHYIQDRLFPTVLRRGKHSNSNQDSLSAERRRITAKRCAAAPAAAPHEHANQHNSTTQYHSTMPTPVHSEQRPPIHHPKHTHLQAAVDQSQEPRRVVHRDQLRALGGEIPHRVLQQRVLELRVPTGQQHTPSATHSKKSTQSHMDKRGVIYTSNTGYHILTAAETTDVWRPPLVWLTQEVLQQSSSYGSVPVQSGEHAAQPTEHFTVGSLPLPVTTSVMTEPTH